MIVTPFVDSCLAHIRSPILIRGVCDQRTEASELQRSKARDVLDRNLTLMRRVAELRSTGVRASLGALAAAQSAQVKRPTFENDLVLQ